MDPIELAGFYFKHGYNCAQSVLLAYAETYGLTTGQAAQIAAAFGGGMGRLGRTCGAVSGGLVVLGLARGTVLPEDRAAKDQTYAVARRFQAAFRERFGALDCSDLVGADISTPEGYAQARQDGRFAGCSTFVQGAAALLASVGER
jgi:C_GCAxxG_C_C family probable redox protein